MIDIRTRIVAVAGSLILLMLIVDLVRRRRLKEEYSVLWIATGVVLLVLASWYQLLGWITRLIGGVALSSTLFFMGLLFVFFMLLHFSLRVSALERRLTSLVQELGLRTVERPLDDATGELVAQVATDEPRIAVVIPCFNDGTLVHDAVDSIRESEPVEVVVVDDGSTDQDSKAELNRLEARGVRVVRQANAGPGLARSAGVAATSAPYVFALDADDVAEAGALAAMADTLGRTPAAGFTWGDYLLFGDGKGRYRSPDRWMPWTLTYVNPYPVCSLFRRDVLERAGGWQLRVYEDWDLWLRLADLGVEGLRTDRVVYRRRLHGDARNGAEARRQHQMLFDQIRNRHPDLFANRSALRAQEGPSLWKRLVYPVLFGARKVVPFPVEAALQRVMMRLGTGLPG